MKMNSPVKWSIAASAVILAAGICFVHRNQTRLNELTRQQAAAESAAEQAPEARPPVAKPKADSPAAPKAPKIEMAAVTAVASESITSRAQGRMKSEEESRHQNELNQQLEALDPVQLEEFAAEVAVCAQLAPDEKSWWIFRSLVVLGKSDPDKALDLLAAHMEIMKGSPMAGGAASAILGQIAEKNPGKAFSKLDEFAAKIPGLDVKQVTSNLLVNIAAGNLDTALGLMESRVEPLGAEQVRQVLSFMIMRCYTEDQCLSAVGYMNGYLGRCGDPAVRTRIQTDVLLNIGSNLATNKGYDTTEQWMGRAKLSREQYLQMGTSAAINCGGKDSGRWLEWFGRERPYQSLSEQGQKKDWCMKVRGIASDWLTKDSGSFGKWIETQSPGNLKNMCIVEFAHQIAGEHPDTAAGWVQQIDNDEDRKYMLSEVYRKADFKTPEEADTFAKRYGIK